MRILMACGAFPPHFEGGAPVSALLVARMLVGEGHELRIMAVGDEDVRETYEGLEVHRVPTLNIDWNYWKPGRPVWKKGIWHILENGNPRAHAAMRREIAEYRPDVLLTDSIENINVASWAAARSMGVPVAHTLRNAFLLCWRSVMQKNGRNCDPRCVSCMVSSLGKRFFSRYVDAVCGETQGVIERHVDEGYFPQAATRCIPGVIDGEIASAPRSMPQGRPFRIGFIGVHRPFKGLDVLGRAARRLEGDPSVEYVIAGTGKPGEEDIQRQDFPRERTRFLGWSQPEEFFPQIDLLVFPSVGREAFGRVAIEAFGHGVPVIGSDLGGIAETIRPGDNGFLFPVADDAALAECITRVAGDQVLYETLSRGALASTDAYRWDRVASQYTELLRLAVNQASARRGSGAREGLAS
uniref:glycosyltransferase family 4 protein n=1 Tax=Stappia sp. TaxID=1870903 RepID=UPI003BA8A038